MNCNELIYACALNNIFKYACSKAKKVFDYFGNSSEIFSLPRSELEKIFGKESVFVNRILDPAYFEEAEKEIEWAEKNNVSILYISDREYPANLKECCDAPVILFFYGNRLPFHKKNVAIVGTRKATSYGIAECREIVKFLSTLSDPPAIISGLAYGIDITAHTSAIEAGLDTYAVMGTGIDNIYPAPHREYAKRITEHGGLITDFNSHTRPDRINFLQRNRIIAGISDAVIVVESKIRGGAMITANLAISYDREVFAVPGRIDDLYSSGCNKLIEENKARIISSPEIISKYMSWNIVPKTENKSKFVSLLNKYNKTEQNILLALSSESFLDKNTLIEKAGCNPQDALVNLTELEMDGIIEMDLYGKYTLKK